MRKEQALELFGGISATADAVGVTYQAVSQWPDVLPARIVDRLIASFVRQGKPVPSELMAAPELEAKAA